MTNQLTPSRETDEFWISTTHEPCEDEGPDIVGKWLLFCDRQKKDRRNLTQLDKYWKTIEKSNKFYAKVSTAKPNPLAVDNTVGVICIYTTEKNRIQVANELSVLFKGSYKWIRYKYDYQTNNGEYQVNGNKNICKYSRKLSPA